MKDAITESDDKIIIRFNETDNTLYFSLDVNKHFTVYKVPVGMYNEIISDESPITRLQELCKKFKVYPRSPF